MSPTLEPQSGLKPTILLIHGAWHSSETFKLLVPLLEAASYPVITVDLPSSSGQHPEATHLDDMAAIHALIIPLMDKGVEIVIVAHSYGGIPGCASVEGQSVAERKERGEKGGIKSILFIAAVLVLERGLSAAAANAEEVDWNEIEGPYSVPTRLVIPSLYHDFPVEQQEYWYSVLHKQTMISMLTPVNFIHSDLRIPKTYLLCEDDLMLRLELQERVAKCEDIKVVRCPLGHFPFLTKPDFVLGLVVDAAT